MAWIEQRRRGYLAFEYVPADVQKIIGKKRVCESLKTEVKSEAQRRLPIVEARWKAEFAKARRGSPDVVEKDAMFWRGALEAAETEGEKEVIRNLIHAEADDRVTRAADRAGITDHRDPAFYDLPEQAEAGRFVAVATGVLVRFTEHMEPYLAALALEPKTKDMRKATLNAFAEAHPYIADVTRKKVRAWTDRLILTDGKSLATVRRMLSDLRGYWKYLRVVEAAPEDSAPFDGLELPRPPKNVDSEDGRQPFTAAQVVALLQAAEAGGDHELADLIRLGMWTGARIESLCVLQVAQVREASLVIAKDKSAAGAREVPIHGNLAPTVKRLMQASADGYLLSGLPANKYGDRSSALSKRFGRLKTKLGYGDKHVFHSIRKTVVTLLENAGVPENVTAEIVGHEKPTMSYGTYSGGLALAVKAEALGKIGYPGWTGELAHHSQPGRKRRPQLKRKL